MNLSKTNLGNNNDADAEVNNLKTVLKLGIYNKIDLNILNTYSLNSIQIEKYVIYGFENLLKNSVYKQAEEIETIISSAFSELMLDIYDNGIYPEKVNNNKTYKMIIIQNFVENYPIDKLLLHLNNMSIINSSTIYENIKYTVKTNDKIYDKIVNIWNNNYKKLETFLKGKKENFFIKFLNSITPIVFPKIQKIKHSSNINMNIKKGGTGKNNTQKRKNCKKGTRWVENAQKCMNPEEKRLFIIESKKNMKNLAHKSIINESSPEQKIESSPEQNIESSSPEQNIESSSPEQNIESSSPEQKIESSPEQKIESSSPEQKIESSSPKQKIESSPEQNIASSSPEQNIEKINKKKKNKIEIPFIPLDPSQKKCPDGYIQHPRKSRKCVKIEDLHKSSNTKKRKSKIPEIKTEQEIQNNLEEDISPEQYPVEENTNIVEEKESTKKLEIDQEKKEFDEYTNNKDTTDSFLYPHLLDSNFNVKIAEKKEFSDFRYDGEIHDVIEQSAIECKAPFELLPHQQFVKNFLSIQTPYNSLLLYGELGSGKCHAKGTPIMMFDGSIQMVENIKVGDFLMGDDSKPRKVLSLANGRDKMYDIIQNNGDTYRVNEEHILCLREYGNIDNITEISVNDYLQLSISKKEVLKGYKVALDFPEKELHFHPYIVGHSYNKHYSYDNIPPKYKYNTIYNRFQFLAGILDQCGYYDIGKNNYTIIVNDLEQLSNDILFIVRSLGFIGSIEKIYNINDNAFSNGTYKYHIGIKGDLEKIPTKKIVCSKQLQEDILVSSIDVQYVGEDEYYGFTLNGNGRYLMEDFTVTHNTCSAIGVAEEMRLYMKQTGINKKILIVASPNVQLNFRLQLFDENKLHEIGKKGSGVWNLDSCVGYDLLKEIQTTNMTREYVIRKINSIINEYYDFIGYESLANYIEEMSGLRRSSNEEEDQGDIDEKKIRRIFDDRLIIIDEVHNIIGKEDNDNKHTSNMILKLVKVCENLRLLFLSATPMYNSYKEILWLVNIMNINDHRSTIRLENVFQANGDFVEEIKDENDIIIQESGKELLKRKLIGYVSYVRGENPYTFPYRIYPSLFAMNENQIQKQTYPKMQMNGTEITTPLKHLHIYITKLGDYQKKGYDLFVEFSKKYVRNFEEKESFGYTVLQGPISALNMIYPNVEFDAYLEKINPTNASTGFLGITSIFGGENSETETETSESSSNITDNTETNNKTKNNMTKDQLKNMLRQLHGTNGLNNIISFSKPDASIPLFHDFEYKPEILEKYGRVFHKDNIGKYSAKIAKICDILYQSTGIVLIYSKFIEGGLIPMALALEEMGFQRYGEANRSLFKTKPVDFVLNPLTMKPNGATETFSAKYVMITGQKYYSPNNSADLKLVTDSSNKHGEQIRVVLISEAGSEGLDFKNIRQVHILDPWYNMNRVEQVIGRAVRNKSHCSLPIQDRNVEIYMHGTYIDDQYETADLYMYRLAEKKALQIGTVTRILKETAVDCLLNIDQTNFTEEKMNQTIKLILSTNQKNIDFPVGDKAFSNTCDYMETCSFSCNNKGNITETEPEITPTYDNYFLQNNHPRISKRIRQLFREKTFYSLDDLIKEINIIKPFPIEQVYYSISIFLKSRDEWLVDKKGRKGYLIEKDEFYAFQPLEISNENTSIFERSTPLEYKRKTITIEMPKDPILTKPIVSVITSSNKNDGNEDEYALLFSQLQKDVETVLSTSSYIKPLKQNMNWYKYAKLSLRICIHKHKMDKKDAVRYIIYHHMDCLFLKDKLIYLQKLLSNFESFQISNENGNEDTIEFILKKYFIERIDQTDNNKKFILLNSKNNNLVYSLSNDSRLWKEEPYFPENSIWLQSFQLRKELLIILNTDSNKTESNVGFIGVFKENYAFKIKNLLNTRPKPGALCEQADKQKLISKINDLLEKTGRSSEIYTKDPAFELSAVERPNLCVIYELLMRFITEKNNNFWFLSPEQAIASDLDHFVVVQNVAGDYVLQKKR